MTPGRVGALTRSILSKFVTEYAQRRLMSIAASGANLSALRTDLLVAPVGFSETILNPVSTTIYVGSSATTIGLILIAVFGMGGSAALRSVVLPLATKKFSPVARYAFTSACLIIIGATISAAYATIVAGMAKLSGSQWAQMWALMWLLYLVLASFLFAVGLAAPAEILMTISFLFVLVYNSEYPEGGCLFHCLGAESTSPLPHLSCSHWWLEH